MRRSTAKSFRKWTIKKQVMEFAHQINERQDIETVIDQRDDQMLSDHKSQQFTPSQITPDGGFGCARGLIVIPPNFDDPIEEFSHYLA